MSCIKNDESRIRKSLYRFCCKTNCQKTWDTNWNSISEKFMFSNEAETTFRLLISQKSKDADYQFRVREFFKSAYEVDSKRAISMIIYTIQDLIRQNLLDESDLNKLSLIKAFLDNKKYQDFYQEKYKLISEIADKFSFLGVDENWIAVLICTNLVEQAMKKKLKELGVEIKRKPPPSFKDIRKDLGNALKEKENRKLDALFEPKELWRIRNEMVHWGFKMKFDKDEAHAIFVMTRDFIEEIWH